MISPRSLLSTTLLLALTFTSAVTSNEVPTGSGRVIARKAATWNGAHTTDFGCLTSSGLITSLDSGACATFSWKLLPGPDFAPTVALVGSEGTCTLYGDSFKPEGGLFEGSSLLCYDKPDTVKDTPFYFLPSAAAANNELCTTVSAGYPAIRYYADGTPTAAAPVHVFLDKFPNDFTPPATWLWTGLFYAEN